MLMETWPAFKVCTNSVKLPRSSTFILSGRAGQTAPGCRWIGISVPVRWHSDCPQLNRSAAYPMPSSPIRPMVHCSPHREAARQGVRPLCLSCPHYIPSFLPPTLVLIHRNQIFAPLMLIAFFTRQLDITRIIRSIIFQRNNVIVILLIIKNVNQSS